MKPAYLLVVETGSQPGDVPVRRWSNGLEPAFRSDRIAAFVSKHSDCLAIASEGCVISSLFARRGGTAPTIALVPREIAAIAATRGSSLIADFWGGYVVAVQAGSSVRVLRDPSATFPCYFASRGNQVAFASDADILVASGFASAGFDWNAIARDFWDPGIPTPQTQLEGIGELMAGFSVEVAGGTLAQRPLWSPWEYVDNEPVANARQHLSETVRRCVHGWAADRGRLLLSVSGGLDSSIVAACLAGQEADVDCLTLFGEDPSSDERVFARALCSRLRLRLFERPYRLEEIDLDEPLGAHLPRCKDCTHAQAYERAHVEVAQETGADAFVTGNGGDSVFGYSQSASPIADRWLAEGPGRGTFQTLLDVCRQTGCTLFEGAAGALRILRGPRAYRSRPNRLFLHPDVIADLAAKPPDHPWLDAPENALPGKAAHIAGILRVQQSLEPSRGATLPVLNPLMSQPIVEACLAVPSWEWRAGGRDRSLARRAFADALPPLLLSRQVKGSPAHFAGQLVDRRRLDIRDRLLGGRLAQERIIDTDAVREVLERRAPPSDDQRVRILEFTAAEAWLRNWGQRDGSRPDQSGG